MVVTDVMRREFTLFFIALLVIILISPLHVRGEVTADAEVINDRTYLDVNGNRIFVGEVKNTGEVALKDIEVAIIVYSKLLGENDNHTYTRSIFLPEVLEPGFITPFRKEIIEFGEFLSYEVKGVSYTLAESKPLKLEVLSMQTYEDGAECVHITGEVKNNGSQSASFINVIGTFYDESGKVVAVTVPDTPDKFLYSGKNVTYDVAMRIEDVNQKDKIDHYSVIVESWNYNMIPEFSYAVMVLAITVMALFLIRKKQYVKPNIVNSEYFSQ